MFLSFIVPVYNTERYLSECLDSLLTQDIDAHDYEIICVNDGSKDGSLEILREYARQYPNIKVIDKKNEGVATARNIGLDAAKGDFIWFVDSDDFVQANCLKQLFLCSEGACPDCIQMGAFAFRNTLSDEENALYRENRIAANSFANNVFVTRTLFRTDFIRKHGIEFHTELNYSEDKVFISEVLVQNPRIEVLERAMYYYRYRSGSAITAGDLADENRKHKSWIIAVLLLKELYACSPMEHKAAIANNMMADYYAYIFYCRNEGRGLFCRKRKAANQWTFSLPQTQRMYVRSVLYEKRK